MTFLGKAAAAAIVAVVAFGSPAFAQSQLAAADAGAFIGDWELGLDTPQGSMTMALKLSDAGGKVAATLTADQPSPTRKSPAVISQYDGVVTTIMEPVAAVTTPNSITQRRPTRSLIVPRGNDGANIPTV